MNMPIIGRVEGFPTFLFSHADVR